MNKIKPCPFCGGEPKFRVDYGSFGYTPNVIHLICNGCGVDMKKIDDCEGLRSRTEEYKLDLINMWNRRI